MKKIFLELLIKYEHELKRLYLKSNGNPPIGYYYDLLFIQIIKKILI